jgi:hypothetical protein
MAKNINENKQQRKQKFSTREYSTLQNLWTSTCIFKKIRNLQNLLP